MVTIDPTLFLRRVLLADGAVSGACGALMLAGAAPLAGLLGVPEGLLRWAGLSLLPWAALVLWLARRASISRGAILSVIVLNALWAVDCLLLLLSGWVAPTALGVAFLLVQAVTVGVLAELQYVGLRRVSA